MNRNRNKSIMGGETRQSFGIIVSFENATGDRLTLHENGPLSEALRLLCYRALEIDDTYRITAISSPSLIYMDMQGREKQTGHSRAAGTDRSNIPEPGQLGKIDMLWMLHPSLVGSSTMPRKRPT